MSLQEIAATARRHLAAVAITFILAIGLAYHIEHATPVYVDTATMAFTGPAGVFNGGASLLVIDEMVAKSVMSQRGQARVTSSGGEAHYDVALVNLYNEDYPDYGDPYVTVTTTSRDPADVQHTFSVVTQLVQHDLAALQAQQNASPAYWIQLVTIAAPSGPVAQIGSRKRTLAGLFILTIIAAFMIATFLDHHPIRLRELRNGRAPLYRARLGSAGNGSSFWR